MGPPESHTTGVDIEPIRVARPALPPLGRYADALVEVWERGTLSNDGPCAEALEASFAAYSGGGGQVLAASSGDLALTLVVAALGLPRGGTALVPSLGFPSTVHALEWNGLKPRFVDVDERDWCLHAEQLEGQLEGVSAILATHLFGAPCDVLALERLAAERGITLIYDAAQAAGTWLGDRHVSDFGDASVISLGGTKIVTGGEGALAVVRDKRAAERFRRLRRYGMSGDGTSEELGLNAKLSELHAALATLTLETLEQQVADRRRLIDIYRRELGGRGDIALQQTSPPSRPTPNYFVIDSGDARERVREVLAMHEIESRPYFPSMHLMPRFAEVPHGALPVSERLGESLLALPLYSELSERNVEEICSLVAGALDGVLYAEGK